ncbi:MAG: hypothetical protein RSC96_09410, partial [Oscillospiraceae bacterium]
FYVNYCSLRALSRRRARVDLLHFGATIVCNTVALQKSNGRSRATAPTEGVEHRCFAIAYYNMPQIQAAAAYCGGCLY